ncbi:MAG: maleylpyruvate isomerase N-terminal domain-containing protein [Acidimicrobiales bacterium]|nr:maleylpyruvate isomerase N-terminal domain-containing protein [Acidimicrobiales bacterium]
MAIDDVLAGLDPYDLMDAEAARIEAYAGTLDAAGWAAPSRCVGWSRHDLLAHLDATEEYFHAGLAGTVGELFARYAAAGVTDLHAANAQGVAARADIADGELLTQWSAAAAETRAGMRARDGGEVDTSVGAYPTRWQAFHIAGELAIHADDLGAPVAEDEAAARLAWRTRFSCFALAETKPGSEATIVDDHLVRVHTVDGADHELDAATFVAAVAARLPADASIDDDLRAALSTMP